MKTTTKSVLLYMALLFTTFVGAQDIIVTKDAQKIEAKITEVSKTEIRYKEKDNPNGPTFVLGTDEINTIIYQDGKVVVYNQEAAAPTSVTTTPQTSIDYSKQKDIARVESFGGVLVFTDCTPVEQYEVLGDVQFNNSQNNDLMMLNTTGIPGGSMMVMTGSTPQYTDIRNGLVAQAVMANRQVEGILISIPKQGEGRATLIKFMDTTGDKALAKVNTHLGMLIFTDCKPINTYSFVGKIDKAGGMDSDYNILRDRLVKKVQKKYPSAQGIIPHFVSEGSDSAEAIKF